MEKNLKQKYESYYRLNMTTLEEVCEEHTPGFLFFATESDPAIFAGGTYPWHWHTYAQFFYVKEGELTYRTPGGIHHFRAGEGGYINANVPHILSSRPERPTKFVEFLFYPSFVGDSHRGNIMQKYVQPITENAGFEIFPFFETMAEREEAVGLLKDIYQLFTEEEECYELQIRVKLSRLWVILYKLSREQRECVEKKNGSGRLKAMLLYINEHFKEKITLEQIAEVGACSRREVSRTFQNDLHTTPFQYLLDVRLNKAAHMLVNTNDSITMISEACGFSDPSHFTKTFKAQSGMSPKEFRKKSSQSGS